MRKRKILKNLENSSRTKLTATCYASRRPWYYITNIFFFQALITSLSLSVFAWETDKAINRLAISFTLILTTVTCKTAWTRTMPTVSYMSSADKYQIASLIYLVFCCVWHALVNKIHYDHNLKILIDIIAFGVFSFLFMTIQIITAISMFWSFRKLDNLKKQEVDFLDTIATEDSDDETL